MSKIRKKGIKIHLILKTTLNETSMSFFVPVVVYIINILM